MRKLLLTIAIAVIGITVNAQTEKGNWVVGGSTTVSFGSTKSTIEDTDIELKISEIQIIPSLGYFVIDNLAVGIDLTFSYTKFEDDFGALFGESESEESSLAAVLGGTYYFQTNDDKLKPYVGIGGGLVYNSIGEEDADKDNGFALSGKAGLAYFLNDSIAIDFIVNYRYISLKNKEIEDLKTKSSNIGVGVGFSLFL